MVRLVSSWIVCLRLIQDWSNIRLPLRVFVCFKTRRQVRCIVSRCHARIHFLELNPWPLDSVVFCSSRCAHNSIILERVNVKSLRKLRISNRRLSCSSSGECLQPRRILDRTWQRGGRRTHRQRSFRRSPRRSLPSSQSRTSQGCHQNAQREC